MTTQDSFVKTIGHTTIKKVKTKIQNRSIQDEKQL